jgi:hypothetical protein
MLGAFINDFQQCGFKLLLKDRRHQGLPRRVGRKVGNAFQGHFDGSSALFSETVSSAGMCFAM